MKKNMIVANGRKWTDSDGNGRYKYPLPENWISALTVAVAAQGVTVEIVERGAGYIWVTNTAPGKALKLKHPHPDDMPNR